MLRRLSAGHGRGEGGRLREGERAGIRTAANERLVDIVKKVERGELQQDPRHINELRLN